MAPLFFFLTAKVVDQESAERIRYEEENFKRLPTVKTKKRRTTRNVVDDVLDFSGFERAFAGCHEERQCAQVVLIVFVFLFSSSPQVWYRRRMCCLLHGRSPCVSGSLRLVQLNPAPSRSSGLASVSRSTAKLPMKKRRRYRVNNCWHAVIYININDNVERYYASGTQVTLCAKERDKETGY